MANSSLGISYTRWFPAKKALTICFIQQEIILKTGQGKGKTPITYVLWQHNGSERMTNQTASGGN